MPRKGVRQFGLVAQHRDLASWVEGLHEPVLHERDAALREGGEDCLRRIGRRRNRRAERHHDRDVRRVTSTALREVIVQQQGGLAWRRWALEGLAAHADDCWPTLETRKDVAKREGPVDRENSSPPSTSPGVAARS